MKEPSITKVTIMFSLYNLISAEIPSASVAEGLGGEGGKNVQVLTLPA